MKLEKLDQILTEKALANWLDLPFKDDGKNSRVISAWIRKGLVCAVKLSKKRYFYESDIIKFFNNQSEIQDNAGKAKLVSTLE